MKSLSRGAAYLLSLGAACAVIPQVAAMSSAPAPELKEHYTGPASGLAQGCFVLQSPASGLFVQYEPNSGITDGKPAYSVSAESEALASRFYLKPSRQDHFLFRDTD